MGPLVPAEIGPERTGIGRGLGLDPADGTETTRPARPGFLVTAGALTLPRDRLVRVNDSLDPGRTALVYRIPIDDATESVGIELYADGPGTALREAMTLTDESGRELASCTPPPGSRSLWIGLPPAHLRALRARGAALYLTISVPAEVFHGPPGENPIDPGQPADSGDTPDSTLGAAGLGFVLVVQRVDLTPGPAADDQAGLVMDPGPWSSGDSRSEAPGTSAVTPGRTADPADTASQNQTQTRVQLRSTKGVAVPTGSLPRRATGPLGGILALSDEETVADRSDPARIDLALIDLSDGPGDDGDATASSDDGLDVPTDVGPREDAVVSVRGPGGVPLFGTSLMTESRSERSWDLSDLPAIVVVPASPVGPVVLDSARRDRDRDRKVTGRRVTSLAALTAASMMAAHLGLPDLTDPLRRWARPPR